jgi:hypothetical protein
LLDPTTENPYRAATICWRASDGQFGDWEREGVLLADDGTLQLDAERASPGNDPYPRGQYEGHNFYNGAAFFVGEAVSPETEFPFGFSEAIPSWNADTPGGTWIEAQLRAKIDGRRTKWYSMGVWAADCATIRRHSVRGQGDDDGSVFTDTHVLRDDKRASAFRVKLRLFSESRHITPAIQSVSVTVSTAPRTPRKLAAGDPSKWNSLLGVPQYSQMVYPDGGRVWCSPVSVAMVMAFWEGDLESQPEERVRAAVDGVYDPVYDGHGNWAFNAAYAGSAGKCKLQAHIARFTSMAEMETWIAAGVPVVFSYAWGKDELSGAAVPSSDGHLAVVVGFDRSGNPIVNDPAAPNDATVQRTYPREELEKLWLQHSGGTVYLIYPPDYLG